MSKCILTKRSLDILHYLNANEDIKNCSVKKIWYNINQKYKSSKDDRNTLLIIRKLKILGLVEKVLLKDNKEKDKRKKRIRYYKITNKGKELLFIVYKYEKYRTLMEKMKKRMRI